MTTPVQTASISLTPVAAEAVHGLFRQRNLDESYALRVYISGQGCSGFQYGMGFENRPSENDTVFESGGMKILIDEVSIQYMAGATIDYIDDERGRGFLVDNPNTAPACSCESGGCGTSEN